jgi:heptosyltransferase I
VWPTILSRAPRRVGFDRARAHEGVWLAANEHLAALPRAHTADMFLEFAAHLGVRTGNPEWKIEFSEAEIAERSDFFQGIKRPVVTVVPASGSVKKDWLTSRWIEVVDALDSDFGFDVVIAGGPGEREQRIAREISSGSSAKITWGMGDSVRRLASIVAGSDLVIAPDTGPVHIARALGVPVVGIYGHTNPWRVGPWRAYRDLWVDHYTDADSAPDPSNRTPKWNRMQTIATRDVLERVKVAVERYQVMQRAHNT